MLSVSGWSVSVHFAYSMLFVIFHFINWFQMDIWSTVVNQWVLGINMLVMLTLGNNMLVMLTFNIQWLILVFPLCYVVLSLHRNVEETKETIPWNVLVTDLPCAVLVQCFCSMSFPYAFQFCACLVTWNSVQGFIFVMWDGKQTKQLLHDAPFLQ